MFSFRTLLSRTAVALLACALISSFVSAQTVEPPKREIWKAGDMTVMTVTAIQDLPFAMQAAIFNGPASEKEKAKYFTDGKAEAGVNVFLLRVNGKLALFDAGAGVAFGSPGKLPEALADLGVKPEDVDFVLVTHMHMDHIGGLLQEGKRAFPKAKILVSKPELAAWTALDGKTSTNEVITASVTLVKAVTAAYGADLQTFAFGDTPLPGISGVKALDAAGHTPGHTAFQLTAGGKSLLIVGDLIHAMPLQFALPAECASFDMDPAKAILARNRIFALAAKHKTPIAGMHFPFAKVVGTVAKDGKGWKFKPMR